jgi:hypothetical protein
VRDLKTIHLESHWENGFRSRVSFCGVRTEGNAEGANVTDNPDVVDCILCLRTAYQHFREIADHSTELLAARSRKVKT